MSEWTDERIELLKTLWLEGATSTVISQRLQISRSAALGKIRRLGMQRSAMALRQEGAENNDGSSIKAAPSPTVLALDADGSVKSDKKVRAKKTEKKETRTKSAGHTASPSHAKPASLKTGEKSTTATSFVRDTSKGNAPKNDRLTPEKPVISERVLETLTSAFLHKKSQSELEHRRELRREEKLDAFSALTHSSINLPFQVPSSLPTNNGEKSKGITIWELRDNLCKWPMGGLLDPPEFFCGAPISPGCPWCVEHRTVAFTREPARDGANSMSNKQPKR